MNTPNEPELLACPFCGAEAKYHAGIKTHYVMCSNCEAMGPDKGAGWRKDGSPTIAAWNTRPAPAAVGDVEGVRAALLLFRRVKAGLGADSYDGIEPRNILLLEEADEAAKAALAQPQPPGGVDEARARSDWFAGEVDCDGESLTTLPTKLLTGVVDLIECFPGYGTCTNRDGRLKDQARWVAFYNAVAALRDSR